MIDLASNLKFHIAIDNHHEFGRVVNEIFPPLAGGVGPQTTGESSF